MKLYWLPIMYIMFLFFLLIFLFFPLFFEEEFEAKLKKEESENDTGWFFLTVPPNFQYRNEKWLEVLFHEIFDVQEILVGWTTFFFLALKFKKKAPCIILNMTENVNFTPFIVSFA